MLATILTVFSQQLRKIAFPLSLLPHLLLFIHISKQRRENIINTTVQIFFYLGAWSTEYCYVTLHLHLTSLRLALYYSYQTRNLCITIRDDAQRYGKIPYMSKKTIFNVAFFVVIKKEKFSISQYKICCLLIKYLSTSS